MGLGSSSFPQDKHILIVGAGYGGTCLAHALLKKHANFTIVDAKDCMHHNVASVRAVVKPGFAKRMVIRYEPTFGKHFHQGQVSKIDVKAKVVFLEDGSELTYDILVIATGSSGPMKESRGTSKEIVAKYSKIAEEVQKSQHVVIIGGGPAGVEVAGEVATLYKDKKVTVIHDTPKLISPAAPAKFNQALMKLIEQMHINLILEDRVENISELPSGVHGAYQIKTAKGQTIEADMVLTCTGLKVNTSAFASGLSDHMEENGALKVNEFFQVEGCEDVFAFGDCCNIKEARMAYVAKLQANVVLKNLENMLSNHPLQQWKSEYVKFFMAVSMGRDHGVGCMKSGMVLPEFIIVHLKAKDMMTGQFFKDMNQTPPPD